MYDKYGRTIYLYRGYARTAIPIPPIMYRRYANAPGLGGLGEQMWPALPTGALPAEAQSQSPIECRYNPNRSDGAAWVCSKRSLLERPSTWVLAGGIVASAILGFIIGRATS